ncbi:MAG: DUF72 domain-containing protein [Candidatus Bathyarchaeota archaeon]|nr:DUF72 domain-containing protein [Candidatus Bathyarchaeota archaeon]
MTLHVGTMGWSYDFWKGNFYPEDLSSKEYLAYYASQFDTVEVDSTFYRIPRKQSVVDWREQTPENFLFSLKFPQVITHVKMLRDCQREVAVFLERVGLLEKKLCALLLQFPYTFGIEQVPLLHDFLRNLPKKHRYVVEVRNRKLLNDGFYNVLRNNSVALAWVDSPFMPQTSEITADFIYVRWEGDHRKVKGTLGRREVDRTNSIKSWADKLKPFVDGQTEVFGYFSKYYSGHSPSDVKDFLKNVETDV